jgi:hypothetical protein
MLLDWSRLEGLRLPDEYRSRRVTRHTGLGPQATLTLCDIQGAGSIQHIWMTLGQNNFRNLIVRMYWDGEEDPSVEAPITDLFGLGHNLRAIVYSTPVMAVLPNNGLNLYSPMPFDRRARITLTNENDTPVQGGVYFQADYIEFPEPPGLPLRFHAQWRRDNPAIRRGKPYTIAEGVGRGYFLGATYHIAVRDKADSWWHGGGDRVFLDGGTPEADVLHGIGGEDFFGASWGISEFQTPYCGCLLAEGGFSMYRFFLEAPIRFLESFRVSFGAMANDITSVGYWYQSEPHHRFTRLPPGQARQPESEVLAADYDVPLLSDGQGTWAVLGPFAGGIEDVFPPEEALALGEGPDLSGSALYQTNYARPYRDVPEGADRPVRWERVTTDLWWLDLNALLMPKLAGPRTVQTVQGVAYVAARATAAEACSVALRVTFDDSLKVWLNGRPVYTGSHPDNFATTLVPLSLRAGGNTLLLKTDNSANENWNAWCLSLRLCEPDGAAAEGLLWDPLAKLPESLLLLRSRPQ